jgi:undecaprenyl-diphosphatase
MFFWLAILQGLCEFLPISSSAHLWFLPWFFKIPYQGLLIDVVFHLATLFALLFYFRKEFGRILLNFWQKPLPLFNNELILLLLATFPAGVLGWFFREGIEKYLRSPFLIAFNSAFFGLLLIYAHYYSSIRSSLDFKKALFVGCAQALSLAPGVSRSGITYTAGRLMGLSPLQSFRFSMLLSVPTILGASLLEMPDFLKAEKVVFFLPYFFLSFIVGLFAIFLFQKLIKSRSGILFVGTYRIFLSMIIILLALKISK